MTCNISPHELRMRECCLRTLRVLPGLTVPAQASPGALRPCLWPRTPCHPPGLAGAALAAPQQGWSPGPRSRAHPWAGSLGLAPSPRELLMPGLGAAPPGCPAPAVAMWQVLAARPCPAAPGELRDPGPREPPALAVPWHPEPSSQRCALRIFQTVSALIFWMLGDKGVQKKLSKFAVVILKRKRWLVLLRMFLSTHRNCLQFLSSPGVCFGPLLISSFVLYLLPPFKAYPTSRQKLSLPLLLSKSLLFAIYFHLNICCREVGFGGHFLLMWTKHVLAHAVNIAFFPQQSLIFSVSITCYIAIGKMDQSSSLWCWGPAGRIGEEAGPASGVRRKTLSLQQELLFPPPSACLFFHLLHSPLQKSVATEFI